MLLKLCVLQHHSAFQADTSYYVTLRVTNHAGANTVTHSRPIVLDLQDPTAGAVHNGAMFIKDVEYQSNTESLSGMIIISNVLILKTCSKTLVFDCDILPCMICFIFT